MSQSIVAVTDRADLKRFCALHPKVDMTVLGLGDVPRLPVNTGTCLLIDVDLGDAATVRRLKPLADAGPRTRIVLVDRGVHQQAVQARCLGATDVVERPLTLRSLARVGATPPAAAEPEVAAAAPVAAKPADAARPAVQAGADLLVSLFAARAPGALIDMATVNHVGNQVLAAVAQVGLDHWLTTVRAHHAGTFQHCLLVTGVAASFGRFLGISAADLRLLTATALVHDIGKAQIPLAILNKPGRLSDDEFAIMREHAAIGYDMLKAQPDVPRATLLGVRHHHEYLDGSGYPDGLAGDAIDALTRTLTIADIYGALIEKRAYKKPRTPAEAMPVLRDLAAGGKIDRALAAAFGAMVGA
jgi:putative nucleotidyltransferase with HDIG domain